MNGPTRRPLLMRRPVLAALLALPGCSALQSRPYVEPLRFRLDPVRPGPPLRGFGRQTVLVRLARAAPGTEGRMLRSINPDGTVHVEYYAEWVAPPAEAMDEALRRWLVASGLFAAVLAPGTRASSDLVLETELTALHADLGQGLARASLSAVLLREGALDRRAVRQFTVSGTAPLPPERPLRPEPQAQAMVAALAGAFMQLEQQILIASR